MEKAKILIVEDEVIVAEDLEMAITEIGYDVIGWACSEDDAIKKAIELKPDIILMDIVLKGKNNGIDASQKIKKMMDVPIIFLTAYSDIELINKAKSSEPHAYIVKPFQERQLLASIEMVLYKNRMEKKLKENFEKLQKTLEGTVNALSSVVEMRDPYTAGHQRRVTRLAYAIAKEMNLSKTKIEAIRVAGTLHDIGKIYIPAEILSNPSKLNEVEMNIVKTHAQVGYDILKTIESPWPVAQIVLQHHERINGSGYPNGLVGQDILLEARILGVADVVEAMASHRPYRPARGLDITLKEISENKGILYDPKVADACLKLFKEKKYKLE